MRHRGRTQTTDFGEAFRARSCALFSDTLCAAAPTPLAPWPFSSWFSGQVRISNRVTKAVLRWTGLTVLPSPKPAAAGLGDAAPRRQARTRTSRRFRWSERAGTRHGRNLGFSTWHPDVPGEDSIDALHRFDVDRLATSGSSCWFARAIGSSNGSG